MINKFDLAFYFYFIIANIWIANDNLTFGLFWLALSIICFVSGWIIEGYINETK